MSKILVLYPNLFNCYPKFLRKVKKIISNLSSVTLIYPSDPNQFIQDFSKDSDLVESIQEIASWTPENLTHAIVFDYGEVFSEEVALLISSDIPLRYVQISITRVINIKKETKYQSAKDSGSYEYIGRGSYWGNPYSMYEKGEGREEVIRKYKYDFNHELFPNKDKSEVYKLAGKRLGCFCKPQACHGDVLADFLNSWDDGK